MKILRYFSSLSLSLLSLFFLLAWSLELQAATFCVDDSSDGVATISDCDSDCTDGTPNCSLRDAITASNNGNAPTVDRIIFRIPGGGIQTIQPTSDLTSIDEPITIDGYTQSGSSKNTLADANNAVINIVIDGQLAGGGTRGLTLSGGSSTVQGLKIIRFSVSGITLEKEGANFIQGNFIGTDGNNILGNGTGVIVDNVPDNIIGGTAPEDRNIISGNGGGESPGPGILISGNSATGNRVLGNLIGPDFTGLLDRGNKGHGVFVSNAPNNVIGGTVSGSRNVISGNNLNGVQIAVGAATGNSVLGNMIGTDVGGVNSLGNGGDGVRLFGVGLTGNVVGGNTPQARNVISGNKGNGVRLEDVSTNRVLGNFIGTDITGTLGIGNTDDGVFLITSSLNDIGGMGAGEGNTIAFNSGNGVNVISGTGNAILSNSIFSNVSLGIDLGNDGMTPNDLGPPHDADGGANNLQNFPTLSSATVAGCTTTIEGVLHSTSSRTFRLEFFSNPAADPNEGRRLFFSSNVTTDPIGDATFSIPTPLALTAGDFVTVTATDLTTGDTSEFSPGIPVMGTTAIPGILQFDSASYSVNENGGFATITVTRFGGSDCPVAVDFTTSNGTALAGLDYTTAAGTLTWADGDGTGKTFTVPILDDALVEGNETIHLTLSNPTGGAALGTPNPSLLTIVEDDVAPSPPLPPVVSVSEGGGCGLGEASPLSKNFGSFLVPLLTLVFMGWRRKKAADFKG